MIENMHKEDSFKDCWLVIERKSGPNYRVRAGEYQSLMGGTSIVYYAEVETRSGIFERPKDYDKIPHEVAWIGTALAKMHPEYREI